MSAAAHAYNGEWLRIPQSEGLQTGFIFSAILHVAVIVFSLVALPNLTDSLPPLPAPTIVDIVPIADITNLPPMPKPVAQKKIETKNLEPAPKPEAVPAPPQPKTELDKMTPKPDPKLKPDKPLEKLKKDEKKAQPDPNDFESVLETVEKFKSKPSAATENPTPPTPPAETKSSAEGQPFIPSLPISISDMDALRRQIEACWNLPAGAKNPEDLVVLVWVSLNPDGTLIQAKVVDDKGRAAYDPYYRAAAESALRALLNPRCTPLKLPPEKYQQWKTMTINFDPRQMLGL